MPVISVDSEELLRLTKADEFELIRTLPKMGVEIERIGEGSWDLEVLPDRCDLLSVEGIARAVKGYLGKEVGLPRYETKDSGIKTKVEMSVQEVRPYIVTALAKDVDLDERVLRSLMDVQEKLHLTIGRERSKVAIGIHDLEAVEAPFTYKAVKPSDVSFTPLQENGEMTLQEILDKHEKGREYAWILEDKDRYPVILDSNDEVLSFPPIINGVLTQLTPDTDALFIDMTGTDEKALVEALNILCTLLSDRGAELHSTSVFYGEKEKRFPELTPTDIEIKVKEVEDLLGIDLTKDEIVETLKKMRYTAEEGEVKDELEVKIPPYRHDILHPWDIIEDIAIGYDYENFDGRMPKSMTVGYSLPEKDLENTLAELMIGYGFNEMMNYVLSSTPVEFGAMEIHEQEDNATIGNPVSENHISLRRWILPSLLSNLKENRDEPLPQRIFEIGDVVRQGEQIKKMAGAIAHSKAGFTEMKSIMEGVVRSLGMDFNIVPNKHGSFIEGRCASLMSDETEFGFFGELHPQVITNFDLENPVTAFELDIEKIKRSLGEGV